MSTSVDLDTPRVLAEEEIRFFDENGYVKLKNVLSAAELEVFRPILTDATLEEDRNASIPWGQRDTYQKAFIQVTNLWTKVEAVRPFVFSRRLARIAAELMRTSGVRLYHDQALYKEPSRASDGHSGGHTPWHVDQFYWPLDTPDTCTAWIPLHEVPLEMGPVSFAAGSHRSEFGRALAISDRSESELADEVERAGYSNVVEPFELGEVSFHRGWTFHHAEANRSSMAREVMTVIYMDAEARLIEPRHANHVADRDAWLPGVEVGAVADSPLNPVLYEHG